MIEISIIVPVYGVEKYIAKCIESIKQQTFKDFEVILVNDGSKDDSIAIAEKAIADDERFIILHKENGGQGSARNLGLEHARGKYIAFIDSDDYVHCDYLYEMHRKLLDESADIVTCDVDYVDMDGESAASFTNRADSYIRDFDFLNSRKHISNFLWDKLFVREAFDNIRFDTSMRTNEDVLVVFKLLYGRKIVSCNRRLYRYLQRPGATSKAIHATYFADRVKIKNEQFAFTRINGLDAEYADYVAYTYLKTFVFYMLVTFARYSENYNDDIRLLKTELDKKLFSYRYISLFKGKENRIFLSLVAFKLSPQIFRLFARFWFRNHAA